MSRWPWVTTILAPVVAATPLARDIFYAAFISSERWMQEFWRLVYVVGVGIAVLLGFIEWSIRVIIVRRRARAAVAQGAAGEHMTES